MLTERKRYLTFTALLLMTIFICGKPCNYSSSKRGYVSLHQRTCQHWDKSQDILLSQRQNIMESKLRRVRAQKDLLALGTSMDTAVSVPNGHPESSVNQLMDVDEEVPAGHDQLNSADPCNSLDLLGPSIQVNPSVSTMLEPIPASHTTDSTPAGHPTRQHVFPARYRDIHPEPPVAVPSTSLQNASAETTHQVLPCVILIVRDRFVTALNTFGIWRDYPRRPSYDPDASISIEDLSNNYQHSGLSSRSDPLPVSTRPPPPWPFKNMSIFRLMSWQNNGNTTKSESEANSLVKEVLQASDFNLDDLAGFNAQRESARFDKAISDPSNSSYFRNFIRASIDIDVPSGDKNVVTPHKFTVPGLLYRKLTSVIQAAFHDPMAHHYHLSPFKLFRQSPTSQNPSQERIFGEVYTSDTFLKEHDEVQRHAPAPPDDPNCKREKIVAAIMFSSDATHLTNFGSTGAWPIYLMLGNLSKYFRSQPNSGAMHHVAYIPSLPDSFQDFASTVHKKWKTQKKDIISHCRRELMHAIWKYILDDDFIHAFKYGMVIKCIDGIERCVYPRIFTYSADYPEKVLLATIRDKGLCPCPRCLVPKTLLEKLGLKQNPNDSSFRDIGRDFIVHKIQAARNAVYRIAASITGSAVNGLLKDVSGVPTINAFIERLSTEKTPFNPSHMLVVDLLHEFELGVWKAVYTHLIRILYAVDPRGSLVVELDKRYHQIPTFGRDKIQKFAQNASEMKKLAARDYEDLLQCSIPAFEGLLPEPHNKRLMKLLYRTAEWHALAKARMHTESSLMLLETLTSEFGRLMREFRDLSCTDFATVELPREEAARKRREAAKVAAKGDQEPVPVLADMDNAAKGSTSSGPKTRKLNLGTYKFHSLGDYVQSIRLFGTTDSYSTQLGELAHRLIKRLYDLTNKKDPMAQIAKQYIRKDVLRSPEKTALLTEREHLARLPLTLHYNISMARKTPVNLFSFATQNPLDPAKERFIPKLQEHFLGRLLGQDFDGDTHQSFSNDNLNTVHIINNTIYPVNLLRVNYTTYDIRRDFDTVNPKTHCNIMVRSPETEHNAHPYWYACVLGIFHTVVTHTGAKSRDDKKKHEMVFLWVRWMGVEPGYRSGRERACLPKIGFVPDSDPFAFGFLDPSLVIRGCHMIPSFIDGRTTELLSTVGNTVARALDEDDEWANFYVDIFVDRDMYFRYLGGGVGHLNTPAETPLSASRDEFGDSEFPGVIGRESDGPATHVDDDDKESDDEEDDNSTEGDEDCREEADGDEEVDSEEDDDNGYDEL